MKKLNLARLAAFALAVSIVLPVASSVKTLCSNRTNVAPLLSRSGNPLPPPVPAPPRTSVLSASGNPLPPPVPTPPKSRVLTASGNPLPPPVPAPPRTSQLAA